MIRWIRRNPLSLILGMTVLVWLGAIAFFTPAIPKVTAYPFPQVIPLADWTFIETSPLTRNQTPNPTDISGQFISGQQYYYQKANKQLKIDMQYLANTNGDLKTLIKHQTGNLETVLRTQSSVGSFSLFTQGSQGQLDACINPRGQSTVTSDQFKRNRTLYDWRSERFLEWVIGSAPLHDNRCLWTRLTLSAAESENAEGLAQDLETVWLDWHPWWQKHFPRR